MQLDDMTSKIAGTIDDLRDRTADAVKADGESIYRGLGKVNDRIDDTETTLLQRIAELDDRMDDRWHDVVSATRRTSWPRRLFWLGLGMAAGAATAFLADPDRGHARRSQLSDQVAARARDVRDDARDRAKVTMDRTRGAVIEGAKDMLPDMASGDPQLLQDRIKSEVFGNRDDVQDVVIRVDAPGAVALKGTVPDSASEQDLLAAVSEVEGVIDVRSELTVRS